MKDNIKTNRQYRLLNNIIYTLKKAWEIDRQLLFVTIMQIPVIVMLPLLTTYLSKYVVQIVSDNGSVFMLIRYVIVISAMLLGLGLLNDYLRAKIEWRSYKNRFEYINLCFYKVMDMDYEKYENPDNQTKLQKAFSASSVNNSGVQQIFNQIVNIMSNIIGLVAYSLLLIKLNLYIVILLFSFTVINYYIKRRNNTWVHRNKDNWVPIERKINYIKVKTADFQAAKDMRLYNMSGWFNDNFINLIKERVWWNKKEERRNYIIDIISGIMMFIRDGAAYIFLIYEIYYNNMSAADFIFYFAIIGKYSEWLLGMINAYTSIEATSLSVSDIREFLDIEDVFNREKGKAIPKSSPDIVFKDVSFKYPNCQKNIINNLNINIKGGEKIALVGMNGAGKSTIVKLLSGLYSPSKGSVIVGGNNIIDYNIEEYYTFLSVVFQDIYLMPLTLEENITQSFNNIDRELLNEVIELSGLSGKIDSLPNKGKTRLVKSLYEDAVDLSGGEVQKLALARALYKKGKVIILDEPTAALDPIAENEMYQKYNDLTIDATSIFISHRLSSTRFCDRILFIEDGEIIEEGSHDSLMELKGKYAEMYELQSHYYKEGVIS